VDPVLKPRKQETLPVIDMQPISVQAIKPVGFSFLETETTISGAPSSDSAQLQHSATHTVVPDIVEHLSADPTAASGEARASTDSALDDENGFSFAFAPSTVLLQMKMETHMRTRGKSKAKHTHKHANPGSASSPPRAVGVGSVDVYVWWCCCACVEVPLSDWCDGGWCLQEGQGQPIHRG